MTDTEQSLLALLRRALFGQDTPLPPDADWQSIFEEAVSHSVHLLVYDCLTEQERAAIPKETAAPWRQEVLSAVHKLNREKGITVVLITHHMNEAEEADRVIVMDDGRIALDGTPKEVFTQVEPLRTMGLTVPDTVDLLDRLRKDGLDVPLDALTVDECAAAITAALAKN